MSLDLEFLLAPLSSEAPCGVDLEDTQLLAGFDAFRVFGSATPLPPETEWRAIRDRSLEALSQSRDLRLLAHLAAAGLRIDGLEAFCSLLGVADHWITQRWDLVFPRVDEDALLRKNALNCFADRMAVVDAVRRMPVVSHRQLGSFSLRDVELSTGQLAPAETDTQIPNPAQIEATLAASPLEELQALAGRLAAATGALKNIVSVMQDKAGFQSAPDFDPLLKPLAQIERLLAEHLPGRAAAQARVAAAPEGDTAPAADGVTPTGVTGAGIGQIKSRQDAIRAIDAAAAFFRTYEPSSPVPLLLDRAKRLVSKSFMEVLEDIAPDSLPQAKLIGGIKDES